MGIVFRSQTQLQDPFKLWPIFSYYNQFLPCQDQSSLSKFLHCCAIYFLMPAEQNQQAEKGDILKQLSIYFNTRGPMQKIHALWGGVPQPGLYPLAVQDSLEMSACWGLGLSRQSDIPHATWGSLILGPLSPYYLPAAEVGEALKLLD